MALGDGGQKGVYVAALHKSCLVYSEWSQAQECYKPASDLPKHTFKDTVAQMNGKIRIRSQP